MTDDAVHLFLHVPKTGGQTLRVVFTDQLEHGAGFVHLGPWGDRDRRRRGLPPLDEFDAEARARVRCVLGHEVDVSTGELFAGRMVRWATFVRAPEARLASLYNFEMGRRERRGAPIDDFESFTRNRSRDQQVRFLARRLGVRGSPSKALDVLGERLAGFWCAATTESMDDVLPAMFADMGLPAVLPNRANRSGVKHARLISSDDPRVVAAVADDHLDRELHSVVGELERRWTSSREVPPS